MLATVALVGRPDLDVDIDVTRHERHWDCTDVCMYVCRYHALTSMHVRCMHGDKTIGAIAWIVRILQLVSQSWSQPRFQLLLLVLAFIHDSFGF